MPWKSMTTQTLPPCTHSGIVQAANAVHLTAVVLYGPAYVSSEQQAVLPCCEPSVIDLSVSAGKPARLTSVTKAGGYQSGDTSCRSAFRKIPPDGCKVFSI